MAFSCCLLRHSFLIELAIAYQSEFLWAHKIVGTLVSLEMCLYLFIFAGTIGGFQGERPMSVYQISSNIVRISSRMVYYHGKSSETLNLYIIS